jgi:hypothetical protein
MKSILVIDTEDFKDIIEVLKMNEMYCEARTLENCPLQDTTELLEILGTLYACVDDYYNEYAEHQYNKLRNALGGNDEN